LIAYGAGETDLTWPRQPFEAGRDVDAVAEQAVSLHPYLADVKSDSELHPLVALEIDIACSQDPLNLHGEARRADGTRELGEKVVADKVNETSALLAEMELDLLTVGRQSAYCRVFVGGHEPAVADHVGREDCRQAAFDLAR